jgi:hypothetical protein
MKIYDITEATKQELPKQRNPVAAYAQRSGTGAHKDQNKKTTPLRKEKHKKKDLAFESQQLDEFAPFVVAAGWVIRWVAMRALWPAFRWLLKKMFKVGVIGGTGFVIADWTWDKITSIIGEEATRLLIDNKIELALAAAFIVSAVVVKRWIEGKGDKLHAVKENIEQARGSDKMPKKKLGRTKHPLNGKLVGDS